MDEYLRYLGTQTANRQIFLLNSAADFHSFEILYKMLRAAWARLGSERDKSSESHAGFWPFANILARRTLIGFQHLSFYQSFLAWLTFRPGLEALLMTGKFVDGPANADVWKNREADWKAYQKVFFRERAAHYLGEINALHPFREGNTRAQREFIRELAVEAGYEIAWDLVTQASFHRGSSEAFATILNKIIRPVR